MWMFTPGGVYMPGLLPVHHIPADNPEWVLQVRTRRAVDLDRLREIMGDKLGPNVHTPMMDYNYRAYCSKESWAEACYQMAMGIDYIKFKEQSEIKYPGPDGKLLHDVYISIWSTLTRLGKPYEGKTDALFPHGLTKLEQEALDYLTAMDGERMTREACFAKLAKMPVTAWRKHCGPEEAEEIFKARTAAQKAPVRKRDKRGRFAKAVKKRKKVS